MGNLGPMRIGTDGITGSSYLVIVFLLINIIIVKAGDQSCLILVEADSTVYLKIAQHGASISNRSRFNFCDLKMISLTYIIISSSRAYFKQDLQLHKTWQLAN